MEKGEIVPSVRVKVRKVHDAKTLTNDRGDYTVQTLSVMDASGACDMKLWECSAFDVSWTGTWLDVQSTADASGKLRGVMVDIYREKREIKVSGKSAIIEQATDLAPEPAAAAPPAAPAPRAVHQPSTISPQPTRPAPVKPLAAGGSAPLAIKVQEKAPDGVTLAKQKLSQIANALILSYDAALHVANSVQQRNEDLVVPLFSPDILEKLAVSMCIELARNNLVASLPVGALPAKKAPLPPSQMEEPPDDYGSIPE